MAEKEDLNSKINNQQSLPRLFREISERNPKEVVYSQAVIQNNDETGPRGRVKGYYKDVSEQVWRVANYLVSIGINKGERVSVLSYTRPEWMVADLGILSAGATSVSIYQSINAAETGYILNDSGAQVVFAENKEQVDKLLSLLEEPCPIPATEEREAHEVKISIKQIISFEKVDEHPLVKQWDDIIADDTISNTPPRIVDEVMPEDLATLVYTSGTTGPPKGVMQTHGNHLANLFQSPECGLFDPGSSIFLFLPLAHSFARLVGYIGFLSLCELRFPAVADRETSVLKAASVMRDLREGSATCVPTVPRILEKMQSGVLDTASGGGIGSFVMSQTISAALAVYKKEASSLEKTIYSLTGFVRAAIRKKLFGKDYRHCVSGGAKLPESVGIFFWALGMPVYEGYGLTETCVATNVNPIGRAKLGGVGPVFSGIEIQIAGDGEILFRGPNIAKGYLNRPQATSAAWDKEGWFHTGDLGRLDEDGYLFITGRKKELIVTAGGKKVAPQPVEEQLTASPYVSHALMYGDGRPYCVALISIETAAVDKWLVGRGIRKDREIVEIPEVQELIWREVEAVNVELSRFETIKKIALLPEELTVENGFLTPSFKVKKKKVFAEFSSLIEELYAQPRVPND